MTSAALLAWLVVAAPTATTPLELHLEPLKATFRRGESVLLRVFVRNPLSSSRIVHLQPTFWPLPYTSPLEGNLALRIDVRDSDGRLLEPTRAKMILSRPETHPSMFRPLAPGEFFGEDVSLDSEKFGFRFSAPGKYIVSATIATEAQRWFDRWTKSHDKREAAFDRDDLFVGPVGAGPVTVELVK